MRERRKERKKDLCVWFGLEAWENEGERSKKDCVFREEERDCCCAAGRGL